jgi:hypothetical protein
MLSGAVAVAVAFFVVADIPVAVLYMAELVVVLAVILITLVPFMRQVQVV